MARETIEATEAAKGEAMKKLPSLLAPADVAALLGITTKTLRKHERFWGLVRVPMATKAVRYEREAALRALRERGLLSLPFPSVP